MRVIALSALFVASLIGPTALFPQSSLDSSTESLLLELAAPEGEACPCLSGTPENEADCGLAGDPPVDATNGGCNSTPNVFSPISCGETVCGTVGTKNSTKGPRRDTDWYALILAGTSKVEVTLAAQFADFSGIVTNGAQGPPSCGTQSTEWTASHNLACVESENARLLSAGTWWIFVASQGFSGISCGTPYTLTVICPIFANGFEQGGALCFWSDTSPPVVCE
jgi:hypothetical protein